MAKRFFVGLSGFFQPDCALNFCERGNTIDRFHDTILAHVEHALWFCSFFDLAFAGVLAETFFHCAIHEYSLIDRDSPFVSGEGAFFTSYSAVELFREFDLWTVFFDLGKFSEQDFFFFLVRSVSFTAINAETADKTLGKHDIKGRANDLWINADVDQARYRTGSVVCMKC